MVDDDVLRQAVNTWGMKSQIQMAQEECAELIVALSHYQRNPTDATFCDVVNELADVKIMVAQMELLFGQTEVAIKIGEKMAGLQEKLRIAMVER
jgi:NTP pyrophosphatase (non-canonical NTP hydrolase)